MRTFYTHDNGGRPFMVKVTGTLREPTRVDVFTRSPLKDGEDPDDDKRPYDRPVLEILNPMRVFPGPDDHPLAGRYRRKNRGNSVLVRVTGKTYIYIGSEIFRFRSKDKIRRYYSTIGNSDVPYPYAVGKTYTYLMIEDAVLVNADIDPPDPMGTYSKYYGHIPYDNPRGEALYKSKDRLKLDKKRVLVKRQ